MQHFKEYWYKNIRTYKNLRTAAGLSKFVLFLVADWSQSVVKLKDPIISASTTWLGNPFQTPTTLCKEVSPISVLKPWDINTINTDFPLLNHYQTKFGKWQHSQTMLSHTHCYCHWAGSFSMVLLYQQWLRKQSCWDLKSPGAIWADHNPRRTDQAWPCCCCLH